MIWLMHPSLMKDHRFNRPGLQNVFRRQGQFTTWEQPGGSADDNGGCYTQRRG